MRGSQFRPPPTLRGDDADRVISSLGCKPNRERMRAAIEFYRSISRKECSNGEEEGKEERGS